ncbi:MAG: pyridoxamine 5'-phosphate oxidase family protein [Campylobacteraceae bacterium]|jgi:nitroimidazol reductase NimA-like FMN-containing flavoprotein (pyridoxamine 5'-phosphate oxidase superfamily)|nr:pyridoxamine 5'-phosphate oxidase family protein [Campylobacteraceae bacterium]
MRRAEFEVKDESEFEKLLKRANYGTLCLNDKPFAYAVPVNFIYQKNAINFHGAILGRKYDLSLKNKKGSFGVVEEYSFIPSYFSGDFACYASQYFMSAFIEGDLLHVEENVKKARILEALMDKYQSEGEYLSISQNLEKYIGRLDKTAVYELNIASWSLKVKMGQNMKQAQLEDMMNKLQERGLQEDISTVETIKKIMLHAKNSNN